VGEQEEAEMAEVKQEVAQVGRLSWARAVRAEARRVERRKVVVCMFAWFGFVKWTPWVGVDGVVLWDRLNSFSDVDQRVWW